MTFQERVDVAQEYRTLGSRFSAEGETAVAGEMLWGAVHNAIQAIGIQHNLLERGREEIRRAAVVSHLVNVHGYSDSLYDQLRTAGELHGHFYNRNVAESRLLRELMPSTQQYIDSLLNIAGTH